MAPKISRPTQVVSLCGNEYTGDLYNVRASMFSKSDALCVEFFGSNSAIYGHRNGSVTLVDFRSKEIQKIGNACEHKGFVSGMTVLNKETEPFMFLAKHSFGSCSLFDIRKSGGIHAKNLVFNLEVDSDLINPTLSSCCSGVGVDPSASIAVSPYVDDNRKVHIAVFSLKDGRMIGSKPLQNKTDERLARRGAVDSTGLPHCELRSTITPSWYFENSDDGGLIVKQQKHAWSLWFKSGTVQTTSPSCMGSIHQLSLPGSILC